MIKTDTKTRYIEAIKDLRSILLGPCPVKYPTPEGRGLVPKPKDLKQ